jgi:hypothetical protein
MWLSQINRKKLIRVKLFCLFSRNHETKKSKILISCEATFLAREIKVIIFKFIATEIQHQPVEVNQ